MDSITGEIKRVAKTKSKLSAIIESRKSSFLVQGKELENFKKGDVVSITNLEKKKGLLKTYYETTEKSIITLHPEIYLTPEEIALFKYCQYAPLMAKFMGLTINNKKNELYFYRGLRGKEVVGKIEKIASRYPKELKGKFSYKSMKYSKTLGVFFLNILHFGKFPVVFNGDEIKGILLSIDSNLFQYILIDTESGTMNEKKIKPKEAKEVIKKRNNIVSIYFAESHKDFLAKAGSLPNCSKDCPLYNFCIEISRAGITNDRTTDLEKYFNEFTQKDIRERKLFLKTLSQASHPIRGSLSGILTKKTEKEHDLFYEIKISHNEPWIKKQEQVAMIENPPLSREVLAKVEKISFSRITIKSDEDILKPGRITPIEKHLSIYRGIYDFLYASTSSLPFFLSSNSEITPFQKENYIENDETQNDAVNKLLNFSGLFLLMGEHGTGKKFVIKTASSQLVKKGKNILIATQSRKEELENSLKELDIVKNDEKMISILSIYDERLYNIEPKFDYGVIFLDSEIEKNLIYAIAGKAKNIIFVTNGFVPFDSKIPQSNRIELYTQHRFGEHLQHFLQPILSKNIRPTKDREITAPHLDKVAKEFKELLAPDKYVQLVTIKGKENGKNNKWNQDEAIFITSTVKEFAKAGFNMERIGIITPYERQNSLIEELLLDLKIPPVEVTLPENATEKDVIIISFTDTHKIGGRFENSNLLKIALTRPRSKLIMVENKNLHKTSKFLTKLL